ncbi:metal ABC transporter ATP-binding protein [Candidatus Finniella inopinata]|uniref:Metal ABC transporter ATP-binding protein n=1 Tax=Candidatus Finniella inopinata TaxID=1696036 RepID=A0A4Q7DIB1_9PROT|nr:metal ABC transporter ATP-binding protein [Candidatus Finniella inopinata]RZI46058.1 metal ABC transporter ATP-binding protein [Candidatus Finniella inopinata]
MIHFSKLSHFYRQKAALEDISLSIPAHTLTAVVGPNGAGKSTFLKIIAGLVKPSQGQFIHQDPFNLAYLPQQSSLDKTFPFSVKDVVAMGLWPKLGIGKSISHAQHASLEQALERVGLKNVENRGLDDLSGGQFQRVLFARLMLQDADVLLLDEPFAAVDESTTQDLLGLLQEWHRQGKTILAVMHNLSLVRRFFSDTIILARNLVAYGPSQEVLTTDNLLRTHGIMMGAL